MSVLGTVIEVPADLLELFKLYPETLSLYWRASNSKNEPTIGSISKLPMQERELIRELYPGDRHNIGKFWNLDDCTSVLHYKGFHSKEYGQVKDRIPSIIEYGKRAHHIYLGRYWHLVSVLFSGSVFPSATELTIWSGSSLGINPLLYKKHVLVAEAPETYYLNTDEVQSIATLMQDFADEIVTENLRLIAKNDRSIYWASKLRLEARQDTSWKSALRARCQSVKEFYLNIAQHNNTAVLSIG